MSIQSEIVAETNLKSLAEWCRKINGDAWFAEESSALASIPTFSAEAFIAAASPVAVLALITKYDRAADDSHRNRLYFADQVERCDELKADNRSLRAAVSFADQMFRTITSGDGSGHADLSRALLRIAGSAFPQDAAPSSCPGVPQNCRQRLAALGEAYP
jgi:hypothetical protein